MHALDAFLESYEEKHGVITAHEIEQATRRARERALVVRGKKSAGTSEGVAAGERWHDTRARRRCSHCHRADGPERRRIDQTGSDLPAVPLDHALGRRAGMLLGRAKTKDVIDGAIALLAQDGDEILTADAEDIRPLVEATGVHVDVIEV